MKLYSIPADQAELLTQQNSGGVSIHDLVALPNNRCGLVTKLDRKRRLVIARGLNVSRRDVDKATKGFTRFTGMAAGGVATVPAQPSGVAFLIGSLDAVCYTAVRDGKTEKYIHRFKKAARPLLASSHDGQSLLILGGGYRFTERGIVDDE